MMKKQTHTPGPWRLIHHNDSLGEFFGVQVGAIGGFRVERGDDARLIAAAPDLLAALQAVKGACFAITPVRGESCCRFCGAFEGSHHDSDCTMRSVDAAIAKAEGRPSPEAPRP